MPRDDGGPEPRMILVAAVADNGVIARDGAIPWDLPEDMRHFRRTTTGHAMLMGRTTYDEMGALPQRTSIVLTRNPDFVAHDAHVVHDIDQALALAAKLHPDQPLMVVGGAQIYRLALESGAQEQVLSEVHLSPEGDTFYPDWDRSAWREDRREPHDGFDIVWWVRR
ncbi:dihydrofolate reductase, partial [Nocardioides massiliensis]|uniref:Dihydrofolate reductase n=1 Tax=Nocardioides massiliensis TaxID=1325935 RepID=A0ABT9NR38_9ACTN